MLLCALLLAAAMPVCAAEDVTEYRIDEIGLTVEIPSDYDVYLYDNLSELAESDPYAKSLLSQMEYKGFSLIAFSPEDRLLFSIGYEENDIGQTFDDYPDDELLQKYAEYNDSSSAPDERFIYHGRYTWLIESYRQTFSTYITITASTFLAFGMAASSDTLTQADLSQLRTIVDSAVFDEDAEPEWTTRTGPFTYENEDFKCSFRVASNWVQYLDDTMEADEAYFYSPDDEMRYFTLDIYDYWASLSEDEQDAVDPAVIDTQYFLPNDLADLFGYPSGSFSRIRYGDALYFTGCGVYDQDPDYDPFAYTFFITIHNGYIYWFEFEGTTDDAQFADVEQMLSSLTFLSAAPAAQTPAAPVSAQEPEAEPEAEPAPVLPEPALVIPSSLYWAIGFALAAILAIVLVHVLRRQDHTDHDSPRSVRDAEQRERDRRDGPDLGP